ncbi:MAG: patatin-like phospholipase family protein [Syntrophales bacterium]|nr:patatin-like phospholipase family protein [Syntrophales bacterium]
MPKPKDKKPITAISLQGGGALGAYEYGALKAICEARGSSFVPRVVSGISIGAINAALFTGAKGDPIATLDTVWRKRFCVTSPMPLVDFHVPKQPFSFMALPEQNLSLLGNPGMYRIRPEFLFMPFAAPFQTTSIYDTSLLKKTLEEFIDVGKLNRPETTRLVVTAVNVKTGERARFDNEKDKITLDHIIASGSFPVTFPMTRIADEYYWDGGIFINTPVGAAVSALEDVEPDNPDIVRELISVELHRMKGKVPTTLQEASDRFYNLVFSGKITLDRKLYDKYTSFVDLAHEIDKTLSKDNPIRKHKGYKELIRHRKIDRTIVIGEDGIGAEGAAGDFSGKTIACRIEAGYSDAMTAFKKADTAGK